MNKPPRTRAVGVAQARSRLRTAKAYLEVADLVLSETDRDEYLNVSAGLAVLAGIAASDAISSRRSSLRGDGDQRAQGSRHPEMGSTTDRASSGGAGEIAVSVAALTG